MEINYKLPFYLYVKKAYKPLQLAIEDAVELIIGNPEIGESKVGDLVGIRVYKFRFNRQEYLIAYRCLLASSDKDSIKKLDILTIDFYQIGLHQNFYDALKRYLRRE
jgi:hypothetical protein